MKRLSVTAIVVLTLSVLSSAHCVSSFVICFSGFLQDQSGSPGGRSAPMAKSQEELEAFVAATGQSDLTVAESALAEFTSKFPESELKASAYAQVMQRYQQNGNAEKTLALGRVALSFDPEHTVALVV